MTTAGESRILFRVDDTDEDDWFCLKVPEYYCVSCRMNVSYIHAEREIIVWPGRDDPNLLRTWERAKAADNRVRILQYEESFGPCVSFYRYDE